MKTCIPNDYGLQARSDVPSLQNINNNLAAYLKTI